MTHDVKPVDAAPRKLAWKPNSKSQQVTQSAGQEEEKSEAIKDAQKVVPDRQRTKRKSPKAKSANTAKAKALPMRKAMPKEQVRGRGRPTGYSTELCDRICFEVSQGSSLNKIAKKADMPNIQTLYNWLQSHPDFLEMYTRAREERADFRADRIDAIKDKLLAGEIDPNAARVAIDAEKWLAAKEQPRRYGDKVDLNVVSHTSKLTDAQLEAQLLALLQQPRALENGSFLQINKQAACDFQEE